MNMAKKAYVGIGDKARTVKNIYIGVGNKARKVIKAYVGDENGKARQWWPSLEKMLVVNMGRIDTINTEYDWVVHILNRYNTIDPDLALNIQYNSFPNVMKKIGNMKIRSALNVLFPTSGFPPIWRNVNATDRWVYSSTNKALEKTKEVTSYMDDVNRIYIPINRVYLPKENGRFVCKIKLNARGSITPVPSYDPGNNVTVGFHYIDNNGVFKDITGGYYGVEEEYADYEYTLDYYTSNDEVYIDYVSLDNWYNRNGFKSYISIRNLAITNPIYKNCLMIAEGTRVSNRYFVPLPVKKNSITITYDGQTMTVSKTSGDADVYFCYLYDVQEYNTVQYPLYYCTVAVFGISKKAFTCDGNYHTQAYERTYQGYTFAGIDAAYMQKSYNPSLGQHSLLGLPDIPKCDIAPMSVPTGITTYAIEYLGETLGMGKYYDENGNASEP